MTHIPRVGDYIFHEIWPVAHPSDKAGEPRWDCSIDRSGGDAPPEETVWVKAMVTRVVGNDDFYVGLPSGGDWFYRVEHAGWRHADAEAEPGEKPIYTVLVCEGGGDMIPASLALDAVPKGEIWVRRNLRSWPWEQDLFHRLVRRDGGIWMEFKFFRQDQSHRAAAWQSEHQIMVM